jgi:hypothetical protein
MITLDGTLGITTPAETVQGALTTTGNTILGDASTDTLNVGNGGLVKDASGNVGIGQSTPTANLHVRNTGGNATFKLEYGAGGTISQIIGASSEMSLQAAGASSITAYTNGTERMRIDSSGNLLFNSGYGSAATAYGCRAWVNFNGTGTVAIRASGNVSSITDGGTGTYTVNFTTAIVDANYSAVLTCNEAAGGSGTGTIARMAGTATTSALPIQTVNLSATVFDQAFICASVFR